MSVNGHSVTGVTSSSSSSPTNNNNNNSTSSSFDWDEYLQSCNGVKAPEECFNQNPVSPVNQFGLKEKLEVTCADNSDFVNLATVVNFFGPRLQLRLDGCDSSNDIFELVDSEAINPVGTHKLRNRYLAAPLRFRKDASAYSSFCAQILKSATAAPKDAFKPPPTPPAKNLFKVGHKLEAVDIKHPFNICPATIVAVDRHQVAIHLDGWERTNNYRCSYLSRNLFPVGWCQRTGHPLQPPGPKALVKTINSNKKESSTSSTTTPQNGQSSQVSVSSTTVTTTAASSTTTTTGSVNSSSKSCNTTSSSTSSSSSSKTPTSSSSHHHHHQTSVVKQTSTTSSVGGGKTNTSNIRITPISAASKSTSTSASSSTNNATNVAVKHQHHPPTISVSVSTPTPKPSTPSSVKQTSVTSSTLAQSSSVKTTTPPSSQIKVNNNNNNNKSSLTNGSVVGVKNNNANTSTFGVSVDPKRNIETPSSCSSSTSTSTPVWSVKSVRSVGVGGGSSSSHYMQTPLSQQQQLQQQRQSQTIDQSRKKAKKRTLDNVLKVNTPTPIGIGQHVSAAVMAPCTTNAVVAPLRSSIPNGLHVSNKNPSLQLHPVPIAPNTSSTVPQPVVYGTMTFIPSQQILQHHPHHPHQQHPHPTNQLQPPTNQQTATAAAMPTMFQSDLMMPAVAAAARQNGPPSNQMLIRPKEEDTNSNSNSNISYSDLPDAQLVETWSVQELVEYLNNRFPQDFSKYEANFRAHEIDGKAFLLLSNDTILKHLCFKLGFCLKITNLVERINETACVKKPKVI